MCSNVSVVLNCSSTTVGDGSCSAAPFIDSAAASGDFSAATHASCVAATIFFTSSGSFCSTDLPASSPLLK